MAPGKSSRELFLSSFPGKIYAIGKEEKIQEETGQKPVNPPQIPAFEEGIPVISHLSVDMEGRNQMKMIIQNIEKSIEAKRNKRCE